MMKTYSELTRYESFNERYRYLALGGSVGRETFGFDRWINQKFYRSSEWRRLRQEVILRDNGCDLGVEGYDIHDRILVHHMNPITVQHIDDWDELVWNPDYMITTTHQTHNAIHYGDESLLPRLFVPRTRGDTKLW